MLAGPVGALVGCGLPSVAVLATLAAESEPVAFVRVCVDPVVQSEPAEDLAQTAHAIERGPIPGESPWAIGTNLSADRVATLAPCDHRICHDRGIGVGEPDLPGLRTVGTRRRIRGCPARPESAGQVGAEDLSAYDDPV